VIVAGSSPQAKVTMPPLATAARNAASVQLAALPSPTTVPGFDVSTAMAGRSQTAFGGGSTVVEPCPALPLSPAAPLAPALPLLLPAAPLAAPALALVEPALALVEPALALVEPPSDAPLPPHPNASEPATATQAMRMIANWTTRLESSSMCAAVGNDECGNFWRGAPFFSGSCDAPGLVSARRGVVGSQASPIESERHDTPHQQRHRPVHVALW
jgi:hypothetical protein